MLSFSYNEEKKICQVEMAKTKEYDYRNVYLDSGNWNRNDLKGVFQLNDIVIEQLKNSYPANVMNEWKLSFVEHVYSYIKGKNARKTIHQLLSSYTIDRANKLPPIYKLDKKPSHFTNQKIGQYWGKYTNAHGILWEMGTGKTRTAVEIYEIKKKMKQVNHGLVVCPVSMIDKWQMEIDTWSGNKSSIGIKGLKEEKINFIKEKWEWYVVSYETLKNLLQDFLEVIDDKWFIVLDEFTKIKNHSAKRAQACVAIGKKTEYKIILSGTPVTQHAYDLFTPYLFLDGGKTFGQKYDGFIEKYFWKQGYKLIAKPGALNDISNKIFENSTRFVKKDCIDIPDKIYDQRYMELPPYNRSKYDEMVKYCITQINEESRKSEKVTAFVILTQLLRLSQITSGFVKDVTAQEVGFEENPKINALREILEESNGSSVIVWARFIWDTHEIVKLCKELKITYTTLTGETKQDERTNNIALFQSGKAKILIGTSGTGGHGIDLTTASIVIYYSNSYSLEQRLQSEDRAHRAGQRNQVIYIDLLCKNTIDVAIYKILRNKKNIADIVTKDSFRNLI